MNLTCQECGIRTSPDPAPFGYWFHYIGGKPIGIVFMDHPARPRWPFSLLALRAIRRDK